MIRRIAQNLTAYDISLLCLAVLAVGLSWVMS